MRLCMASALKMATFTEFGHKMGNPVNLMQVLFVAQPTPPTTCRIVTSQKHNMRSFFCSLFSLSILRNFFSFFCSDRAICRDVKESFKLLSSGVATHWILWINPGAARCWRAAKCDNVLNEQRQSH